MRTTTHSAHHLLAAIVLVATVTLAQAPPKAQPVPPVPTQSNPQPTPEHHISPEEARELLNSVDAILKFDSENTGLRLRHEVKRQLADREQVQKYIEDRIKDDEDTQRLRRSEIVLKKLGLLPRDFDLQTFLVQLLREQVAGYYDTKTKTVYLLDWLQPASQLPVLAHELTHALQDQNFGLEKWVGKGTSEKNVADEVRSDEEIAARHAIIEGQAMAVMIDYLLAPTGNNIVNSPMITQAIQQGMMESADSPVFNRAPLFIKRVLLFPYRYGLDFERELLLKGGKEKAFAGVFKSPPKNSRQVMEPATYLAGEKLPDLPVPDIAKLLGKDWEKYDVGSIGEFDVAVMAEIYCGGAPSGSPARAGSARDGVTVARDCPDDPKKIYPSWRGGWYYAAKLKTGDELALVMVTKWANGIAAKDFYRVYGRYVPNRYQTLPAPLPAPPVLSGPMPRAAAVWNTANGSVEIRLSGDTVIAIESVPAELMEKVRQAILSK